VEEKEEKKRKRRIKGRRRGKEITGG